MGLVEVGLLLVVDELEDLDLEVAELVSCRAVVLVLPEFPPRAADRPVPLRLGIFSLIFQDLFTFSMYG
jgi:hypothetical protein